MPGLMATFGLNAKPYEDALEKASRSAVKQGKVMTAALNEQWNVTTLKAAQMQHEAAVDAYHKRLEEKAARHSEYIKNKARETAIDTAREMAVVAGALQSARAGDMSHALRGSVSQSFTDEAAIRDAISRGARAEDIAHALRGSVSQSFTDEAAIRDAISRGARAEDIAHALRGSVGGYSSEREAAVLAAIARERRMSDLSATLPHPKTLNEKQNEYLRRKRAIMGTSGSGMAPGFAALISSEAKAQEAGGGLGGNKAFGGAASAMFVSVARDTAASLASGANPLTVIMQQGPQVAQAFTMMNRSAMAFFRTLIFNPITAVVGTIIALAGAAFLVVKHFRLVAERLKNIKEMTDYSNRSFTDQIAILKSSVDAIREQVAWLDQQAKAQKDVRLETEKAIDALKQKHAVEMAVAQKRGDDTEALELKQARERLDAVKNAIKEAEADKANKDAAQKSAAAASIAFESGRGANSAWQLGEVSKREKLAAAIADAAKEAMESQTITTMRPIEGTDLHAFESRKATESDKLKFESGGKQYEMSVQEARAKLDQITQDRARLEAVKAEIERANAEAKSGSTDAAARVKSLQNEAESLMGKIEVLEATTAIDGTKKTVGGKMTAADLTERQRIGARFGGPEFALLDINKQMERHLRTIVERGNKGGNLGQVNFG